MCFVSRQQNTPASVIFDCHFIDIIGNEPAGGIGVPARTAAELRLMPAGNVPASFQLVCT